MALSGSFGTDFSGGYRLQLEWYATQNIGANQSTVRADLYLISKGSSWTINSSATKNVSLTINGNFSGGSGGGLANLGGNQKKQIWWHQVTVTHDSNGTKSIDLKGVFDIAVTLNGSYVASVQTSQTVTLDTIPRNSQITTQPDITAGRPHSFTLERYSSEFDHGVEFFVAGQFIKRLDGVGTSGTFNFSKDEVYIMYQKLQANGYNPVSCAIRVFTYRYGTQIGNYVERGGTCYNWGGGYASFAGVSNYGDSISVTINNGHPDMRYDTEFRIGTVNSTGGTAIKTQGSMAQGVSTVSFSASEKQALLNATPTVTGAVGTARVTTYWYKNDGTTKIQVANSIPSDFWWNGGNAIVDPTFNPTITYADTFTTGTGATTPITGNNQYIVQDMSTVRVTLGGTTKATTTNGTTIKEYVVSLGGKQVTQAHTTGTTDITFDIGTVSATTNLTIEMKAIDARGRYKTAYKTVTIVPYSKPTLVANVTRVNNFENSTEITISGTISPLIVNNVAKNKINLLQYRSKIITAPSFGGWSIITPTAVITGSNFSHPKITNTYDNSYAYSFEIIVQDIFGATSQMQVNRTIEKGKPLFFIDYEKATVGVGKFPESASNGLEVVGKIESDGITTKQGIFQLASVLKQQGNGATEFSYNAQTSDLNIMGRNLTTNLTHDVNLKVTGRIYAKEIYAWNSGGIRFDSWGNILGTTDANTAGNTFSIKDGDGRNRFLTYIGKGSTGSTEISAYTSGIDFYQDGYKVAMLYASNSGVNRILQLGNGSGLLKWQNSAGRFEFRRSDDMDWCSLSGNWVDPSSRDYKKNIETYEESAIDIIMGSTPVTYHFKGQDDSEKKKIGLIAEDAPKIIQADEKGTGIETYGMITLSWKGIQENTLEIRDNTKNIKQLTETVERLEKEIKILKGEN